ncbi:hypothetical protein [Paenibacillus fonticola]|uniref:hypothetical protein n=1 Tax=Paenibacillus fonticola TaxID=379896 RepID=UPI000399CC45|nr:hypothetical protein [Paenibacillus fonticola]
MGTIQDWLWIVSGSSLDRLVIGWGSGLLNEAGSVKKAGIEAVSYHSERNYVTLRMEID